MVHFRIQSKVTFLEIPKRGLREEFGNWGSFWHREKRQAIISCWCNAVVDSTILLSRPKWEHRSQIPWRCVYVCLFYEVCVKRVCWFACFYIDETKDKSSVIVILIPIYFINFFFINIWYFLNSGTCPCPLDVYNYMKSVFLNQLYLLNSISSLHFKTTNEFIQ